MTTIRRIVTSKIDGSDANNTNDDEIRPFGEINVYIDNDKPVLAIHDGIRTHLKSKVLEPGVLYGSNADAGDDSGLDTVKLIPDAALYYNSGNYGNDQYIVVDPTQPNHIHIRAGGTIDDSGAALFLGGENSNMEIQAGQNPPVYVRANSNTWMFDTDGSLAFPGSSNARIGEDEPGLVVRSGAGVAVLTNADSVNIYEVEFIGYIHNGFGDGPGATLTVTEIVAGTITNGMTIYGAGLPPEGWAVTVGGIPNAGSGGVGNYLLSGANILTSSQSFNNNVLAAGSQAWVFESNGDLTFPNNTVQTTAWAGGRVVEVPGTSLGATGDLQGDLAFNSAYMYYCTATYVPNTFSTTVSSPGVSTNTMPIAKGDYGTPTTSWTVTFINVEYAITNVADGGDSWILTIDNFNFTGGTGSEVTLYNGIPSPNIWKRVAWGVDTW